MIEKEKNKGLEQAIQEIQQKFGDGAIMTLKDIRAVDIGSISTGSLGLDLALGIDGIPQGRVIEIFGPESSGKTTVSLHIVAEAQKKGGIAAFVDAEHALDPNYAKKIGVKVKDLLISQPDSGEQALQIVETLVRSGTVNVIVIDSVAALTPRAEIEGEMGELQVGLQARIMSQALRKLAAITAKSKTSVVFLNQTRMKIGSYGNPETTPGGMALKFYSSVRINLRRSAQIKSGDRIIGNRVISKVVKNKVAATFKTAEFDIFYNEGISQGAELIKMGVKYGVVKQAGAWYQYEKLKLGQGLEKSKEFLMEDKKLTKQIKKEILEKAREEK